MKIPISPSIAQEESARELMSHFTREWPDASPPSFLVSVPLRICPIGAHSDHQGGTITGVTIDRFVYLLGRPDQSAHVGVYSANFHQLEESDLHSASPMVPGAWGNYLRGVIEAFKGLGKPLARGFKGIVYGAMPIGGLSSSAAVTIAYAKALKHVNGLSLSVKEEINLVRAVENGYLGLHNGIMDQSVILSGKRDALTCVDCTSETITSLSQSRFQQPWEILVVYSGLSRQLTKTPFNQRVSECREAACELLTMAGQAVPEKPILGAVGRSIYDEYGASLPPALARRARHFFTEAARVREGMQAWRAGDIRKFGELITASGESSIINYESGSPALVSLYEILAGTSGVYGTRFCGGGFQGCCLAFIDPAKRESIVEALHSAYTQAHPEAAAEYSIHFCKMADSVLVETVS